MYVTGAVLRILCECFLSLTDAAGEDGGVKIWSKTGMLRSTLAQLSAFDVYMRNMFVYVA